MNAERFCLTVRDLQLSRADTNLFKPVSFSVTRGQCLWVQGPNGIGKTSLLRALTGLSSAVTAGEIYWCGVSIDDSQHKTLFYDQLYYLGHLIGIHPTLSAMEYVMGAIAGTPTREVALLSLKHYGLEAPWIHRPCGHLSAGQRQRVALARLDVTPTTLWILDEPLTALDSLGIQAFTQSLQRHLQAGGMAVIVSHTPLPQEILSPPNAFYLEEKVRVRGAIHSLHLEPDHDPI